MPFSPKNPASMIGTFAGILIFTMFKELYEDISRMIGDRKVNNTKGHVYDQIANAEHKKKWGKIKMGDIIEVQKEEVFPADILLLYSENDHGERVTQASVDTMNLDGETNLKKQEIADNSIEDFDHLEHYSGRLQYDTPNENLDKWNGTLITSKGNIEVEKKNLLLRGCTLKNTKRVFGVVTYVGPQAKIMMNAKKVPSKLSNMMRLMNYFLYSVFGLQILMIIVLSSISVAWKAANKSKVYTSSSDASEVTVNFWTWILQFLTFWVAYSHMIPISLYVMIEVMKLFLGKLIKSDEDMRDTEIKAYSDVRNSDLIEELGQVQFIFSDKTGTLTVNKMVFKKMSVGGVIYPDKTDAPLDYPNGPNGDPTYQTFMNEG